MTTTKRVLHFTGLPEGTHTYLADATTAREEDGYEGDEMRIERGDTVPVEKITHGENGVIVANLIARGIAVLKNEGPEAASKKTSTSGAPPQEV